MTFWEKVDIYMYLVLDEQCNPVWNMFIELWYDKYFLIKPDQKYSVDLKNLTGYDRSIQSSPEASHSYLATSVHDTLYQYMLEAHPLPENMRAGLDYKGFNQDIKGGSVDNLGITFSYVTPFTARSITTLIFGIVTFMAVLIVVSIFIVRIRTRSEREYLKIQQKLKKMNFK